MIRHEFRELLDEVHQKCVELNETKGHDYAGDEDALSNFKEAAARLGIEKEKVWAVYADKHWQAVMTFCSQGQVESEPIEGRLLDVILYCQLLLGMIREDQAHA